MFANEYPSFTKQEIEDIENINRISKNRILDYQQFLDSCKSLSKQKQLDKMNFYLNRLLPQYDTVTSKKEDYWATPKEFLTKGFGDCEDYAIIKYYSLIKLGFNEKKLFITIVQEKFKGRMHMVLAYFKEQGKSPLILDNLSFKILPLDKREDLKVSLLINSTGVFKLSTTNQLIKIASKYQEFEVLKEKITNNN